MKMTQHLILLIVLVFSVVGCQKKPDIPESQIITKIVEVKQPIPKIESKPTPQKYDTIMVNFKGIDYYAMTKDNANIMASNWLSYRRWAESNYAILKKLKSIQKK